jgi:hypothetical protein
MAKPVTLNDVLDGHVALDLPAIGPQQRSNNSTTTSRPNRFRAWVTADAIGTDQLTFQQPHRSSDPVTLVATSR